MVDLLTELLRSRPTHNQGNGHLIPEFNPDKKITTADRWLSRINTTGEVQGWDSRYKLVTAFSKLRGSAEEWFQTCAYNVATWDEFSSELLKVYPKEIQFGKALEDAATHKSQDGQDLQIYCIKKLGLLSNLNLKLTDQQTVQYVAHGIKDDDIRQAALSRNCSGINELQKFLSNFDTTSGTRASKNAGSNGPKREEKDQTSKRGRYRDEGDSKDTRDAKRSKVKCYKCDGMGHYSRDCPTKHANENKTREETGEKNDRKKYCTFCQLSNHDTEKCWFKDGKTQPTKRK